MISSLKLLWKSYSIKHRLTVIFFCGSLILIAISIYSRFFFSTTTVSDLKTITNQAPIPLPGGFEKLTIPQRQSSFFNLAPKSKSEFGIANQELFQLTTQAPVTASFVSSYLKSSTPLSVKPISPTLFELQPSTALNHNQLITIGLAVKSASDSGQTFDRDYGWTFQTLPKLEVVSTLPGNEKTSVPINTGIELVFNRDDFSNPTPFISVSPKFEFRTETRGTTFIMVPAKPLTYSTIYTISLKSGLTTLTNDSQINSPLNFSFQTESPRTVNTAPILNTGENFIQISPSEQPIVKVYTSNWQSPPKITAEVYQFPSSQLFLSSRAELDKSSNYWYYYYNDTKPVPTTGLSKVLTAEVKVTSQNSPDGYSQIESVQIPQSLPAGFYLIRFNYGEGKFTETWLQSTPLSAYVSTGRFQTLVWANDLSTNSPADGATIQLSGSSFQNITSGTGVSVFNTPLQLFEPGKHYFQITSKNNNQLLLPIGSLKDYPESSTPTPEDYWSYLYQERSLYRPTDSVYFWGVIKNRDTGLPPSSVKVKISQEYEDVSTITETPVSVNSDGSFYGRLSFSDLPENWYSLLVETDGLIVSSRSFKITQYEKPDIAYSITSDKKAIFAGDSVKFSVAVKFFDNTPIENLTLKTYHNHSSASEITTNSLGIAEYSLNVPYKESDYYPSYESVGFLPAQSQTGEQTNEYGSVLVYGSRVLIDSDSSQSGNQASMTATVNQVDLSGINAGTTDNPKGQPASNTKVELTLTKSWFERTEEGTYYDFVEKVTRPRYTYTDRKEAVSTPTVNTNSDGRISYSFTMEPDKSYDLKITAIDPEGRKTTTHEYYYYQPDGYQQNSNQSSLPKLVLDKKNNTYSLGESVKVAIHQNNQILEDKPANSYLFLTANRGRQDFYISESPELTFPFAEKHLPNTTIAALIFNGKYYQPVQGNCQWYWDCYVDFREYYLPGITINYNSSANLLDLNISTSPQTAKPGDPVKVSVKVTKANNPIPNTTVNLVLVDKAMSVIGGVVKPSLTNDLFSRVSNQIYYNYFSHRPVTSNPQEAEMGGGGGDRDTFKDTPFFGSSTTNSEGIAEFTFTLPDNITTWLIYSQAINSNFDMGQSESDLISTKDFFVTSYFPANILTSDKPQLSASAFGVSLKTNSPISYELQFMQGETELSKLTKSGQAFAQINFSSPNLAVGSYKTRLTGKSADKNDTLTLPFNVLDSRLAFQHQIQKTIDGNQKSLILNLDNAKPEYPIQLIISDAGKGQYYWQLKSFCYPNSNRLERLVAAIQVVDILKTKFADTDCNQDVSLADFQNTDGGLGQVRWGGSMLETTAWTTFVNTTGLDRQKLLAYFKSQSTKANTDQAKVLSAWGRSLTSDPQLPIIKSLSVSSFDIETKLQGAIALANAGDLTTARDIYYDILANYAYASSPYIRLQSGSVATTDQSETILKHTALALYLGSLVDNQYNANLYAYLRDYRFGVENIPLHLAEIAYLNEAVSQLPPSDTKLTLKLQGQTQTIDLSRGQSTSFTLTKEQAKNLSFNWLSGKAEITSRYHLGNELLNQSPKDSRLNISKSYTNTKTGQDSIATGDIIAVNINYDLDPNSPVGCYKITDHIPSGLTFVKNPSVFNLSNLDWVSSDTSGRIYYTFCFSPWWRYYNDKIVTYYLKASTPGDFTVEPAIMQYSADPSILQSTSPSRITITND